MRNLRMWKAICNWWARKDKGERARRVFVMLGYVRDMHLG